MQPVFVLVEPKVPENVGAAARALKTMGFSRLWIVNSRAHQQPAARWLAHGSEELLDEAETFCDLAEVRGRVDLLVGTSAKSRHGRRMLCSPGDLRQVFGNKDGVLNSAALVFGREDRGLSNDELMLCDLVSGIPLAVTYPSLNLGQAVMLYAYELARHSQAPDRTGEDDTGAWRALRDRLEVLLPDLGAPPGSKLHRWALERLPWLDGKDVGFLHTLCQNIGRRLPGRSASGENPDD